MSKASLASSCARMVERLERDVFHKNAGNFPGVVAKKLDGDVLTALSEKITDTAIVVSATNGKTTTTNLIADCLEYKGKTVFCNRDGSNLDTGIITTLLPKRVASHAVFECDELYTKFVLPRVRPAYFMLLNLFPDQVDRFGSIENIQQTFEKSLAQTPDTTFVYNADDPYSQVVAEHIQNKTLSFGLDYQDCVREGDDALDCTLCGKTPLTYERRYYGQLGMFSCTECGMSRVKPDYEACNIQEVIGGYEFDVRHNGAIIATLKSPSTGLYMVYNVLAAFIMTYVCGIRDSEGMQACIDAFNPRNGRLQTYKIGEHDVLSNLAKNPVGFNQNIDMILKANHPGAVAFLVNNNEGDGRDIAWIQDVNFEDLAELNKQGMPVFVGGMITDALQERLEQAGLTVLQAQTAAEVFAALENKQCSVYFIANYTALPPVHHELEVLESEA